MEKRFATNLSPRPMPLAAAIASVQESASPPPAPVAARPEPSLDLQDGTRTIQVTTLLDETVVGFRQLAPPDQRRGRSSPHFLIGEGREVDLPFSARMLPAPVFPLVRARGGQHEILFTEAMQGELQAGSTLATLAELREAGIARPDDAIPGAFVLRMPLDGNLRVQLGETCFLLSAVAPPRRLVAGGLLSRIDWASQMFHGVSLATHTLLLVLVFSIPPDGAGISVDSFNTDHRMVRYLIKPKPEEASEVPLWLRRQHAEKQGPSVQPKHAGAEGKAGSRTARHTNRRFAVKGDAVHPEIARRIALESARTSGVLGLLGKTSGGPLAAVFGKENPLGNEAMAAIGNLIGDQIGESYGTEGLSLSGPGRGGGGTATDAIACGPNCYNTIGDRRGDPKSGYDFRRAIPTKRKLDVVPPPRGSIKVVGGLDKELIRREIRKHLNEVRYCYQHELQSKPELSGRVVVGFTISGSGQVVSSNVSQSTMNNSTVESCITKAFLRWSFPKPVNNGIVIVTYPFTFHAQGTSAAE
jgi:TonB family protein